MHPLNHQILSRNLFSLLLLFSSSLAYSQPSTPTNLVATGYDSHIELTWNPNAELDLSGYNIYRSSNGVDFTFLQFIGSINQAHIDFLGAPPQQYYYKIAATNNIGQESPLSAAIEASTFEMTDEELLTMVQQYTFRYFWDFAHPVSGLARERNTTSIVTMGGSGFGVLAILVGIERGFITYEQGVQRLLKIVDFLATADRFHGAFPHWMNGATGATIPFSEFDDGGDLVETAFLIQGLLTARQCIGGTTADEVLLREKITAIWESVEWSWYRKGVQNVLFWHWSPNFQWQMNFELRGFNETHIPYILGIASPTYSIPVHLYHEGWAGQNYTNNTNFYGYPLVVGSPSGGPLFFSHYSYLAFDPRGKRDAYANYFNHGVYQTLSNRAYCIDNPQNHLGYSEVSWGLTASDDPFGYLAHEPTANRDNGTITPTAALSSIPYTPTFSIAALKHFYRDLGDRLWGPYGFYDAYNFNEDWFASSYLAIDQGPIIVMIENYRTGLLWDCFMANPEIQPALDAIGFEIDTTIATGIDDIIIGIKDFNIYPNPAQQTLNINFSLLKPKRVFVKLVDLNGQSVKQSDLPFLTAGNQSIHWNDLDFPPGVYFLHLLTDSGTVTRKIILK